MSEAKTIKEVLIAARWVFNELEWVRGFMWKGFGESNIGERFKSPTTAPYCCCAEGAICLVECDWDLKDKVYDLADAQSRRKNRGYRLIPFNDGVANTKEEVLAFFDELINECE